ncbi:MAG: hypothetical protein E3J30_06110 [Anaerolineales bacterium]|nr:MAG: hypothetical protein E3J30_06110 [Anaerolineales bacterium]
MFPRNAPSADDKMSIHERGKVLRETHKRYQLAYRHTKGKLLDEMHAAIDLQRKSLIRLMHSTIHRTPWVNRRGMTAHGTNHPCGCSS